MVDWDAGLFDASIGTWRFSGNDLEVVVPGNFSEPSAHWLQVARETIDDIDRHHATAHAYLNNFVDHLKFAADQTWTSESIEFGRSSDMIDARFTNYYRINGDSFGLWSVAFRSTGLPSPNDLHPVQFSRVQQ